MSRDYGSIPSSNSCAGVLCIPQSLFRPSLLNTEPRPGPGLVSMAQLPSIRARTRTILQASKLPNSLAFRSRQLGKIPWAKSNPAVSPCEAGSAAKCGSANATESGIMRIVLRKRGQQIVRMHHCSLMLRISLFKNWKSGVCP